MRTLNIVFTDEEFKKLKRIKGNGDSWHDFILELIKDKEKNLNARG